MKYEALICLSTQPCCSIAYCGGVTEDGSKCPYATKVTKTLNLKGKGRNGIFTVSIKDIAHGYPVRLGIEEVLVDGEYQKTGARITEVRGNYHDGDVVTFEISKSDAEKWLPTILEGWDTDNVTIS